MHVKSSPNLHAGNIFSSGTAKYCKKKKAKYMIIPGHLRHHGAAQLENR